MKILISLVLVLCLVLPLWAEKQDKEADPMEAALHSISEYFTAKTYVADHREYVEADLAMPGEILKPLEKVEIPFLELLHNEIAARHGCPFQDKVVDKIFRGTDWYHPVSNYDASKLNGFERRNLTFIEAKERSIIIKGEKEIKGWTASSNDDDSRFMGNMAELEVLSASPTKVRCGGEVKVKCKVKNTGSNSWDRVGTNHTQEPGNYYVSSCWFDPRKPSVYLIVDQFPLPKPVKPGETVEAAGSLRAPSDPGTFYIVFNMLWATTGRFLENTLPDAKTEFENCPKVMIQVVS